MLSSPPLCREATRRRRRTSVCEGGNDSRQSARYFPDAIKNGHWRSRPKEIKGALANTQRLEHCVQGEANGYQVESTIPGGAKLRLSGTSMASPNAVNLAAKLIALDPKPTPTQVIHLIVAGAPPSADGLLHNINPKRSVELLKSGATD